MMLTRAMHLPVQAIWAGLTPELYGLFWTLSAHDIYVPTKTYETEIDKVRSLRKGCDRDEGGQLEDLAQHLKIHMLVQARAEMRIVEGRLSGLRSGPGMGMSSMNEDELVELGRQRDRLKVWTAPWTMSWALAMVCCIVLALVNFMVISGEEVSTAPIRP